MKSVVFYGFGSPDVLQCVEMDKPTPGDHQVLIKVRAAALNPVDAHLLKGASKIVMKLMKMPFPSAEKPGQMGRDVAGVVEAVGSGVTEFKPGDEVFGSALGACAEYVCASDAKLVKKPANILFEEAAAAPVASYTALQGLCRRADVKAGDAVLVNGAAGGVGSFAVQIGKAYGAEVTAISSGANLELMRSIGADHVIDYNREDFTQSGRRYDIIFDLVGNQPLNAISRVLAPNGTYLAGGVLGSGMATMLGRMVAAPIRTKLTKQSFLILMAKSDKRDLETIAELMESGKVKPMIDRRYPLTEVADALRYLNTKRARGKLVIVPEEA